MVHWVLDDKLEALKQVFEGVLLKSMYNKIFVHMHFPEIKKEVCNIYVIYFDTFILGRGGLKGQQREMAVWSFKRI